MNSLVRHGSRPVMADLSEGDSRPTLQLLLCLSYFSIVVSISTLPPCLPFLLTDEDLPGASEGLPRLIGLSSVAFLIGKLTLGWLTDRKGGLPILVFAMAANVLLLLLISFSSHVLPFGAIWLVECFVSSGCWGAVSKLTHDLFLRSEWAHVIGRVAAWSRLGTVFATYSFSSLLAHDFGWRVVFRLSALAQVLMLGYLARLSATQVLSKTTTKNGENATNSSFETHWRILHRILIDSRFWFMFIAKIAFMIVWQFSSFIPLYLSAGPMAMSSHIRAIAASLFPVSVPP